MSIAFPEAYTHRTWDANMADMITTAAGTYKKTEVMIADLERVQAGRTHLAHARRVQAQAAELVMSGVAILRLYDSMYLPVVQNVADMGGLAEVAQEKTYHTN